MASEQEKLVVALEARIRDFERNFQKANRTANDNFAGIEKRAKKSADNLERTMSSASSRVAGVFKSFGAGFAGGILGGLSVAGLQQIARSIGDVANGVAMIGSNAKKAGLSNRSFQELSYVASQARIDVDALADGMKELALRADEWIVTGAGPGAEAFTRLGYTAQELKEKLKDPSALLVDIIARLQQLDKAAQIRVADEIFGGTAGERFVELLDKGADGIRAMIAEAHSFGLVLDDQMIAKADEIDRKFDLISRTIGTKVKGAIVSAAGELLEFMDRMKEYDEQQSSTLGNELARLGMRRLDNENAILKLRNDKETTIGGALLGPAYDKQIEHLEKEQQEIAEAEARILKILGERDKKEADTKKAAADAVPDITKLNTAVASGKSATDSAAKSLQSYGDAIRALKGEIPELADQVAELNMRADIDKAYRAALQNARTMGQVNQANALRDQAIAAVPGRMQEIRDKGLDDASKEARQKAEDQIKAYSDIIASAQEFMTSQSQEANALGMAKDAAAAYRYEQEMLNQAKRDGLTLSDQQRQEIAQYAQGMAHAEKVTQQLADTQEQSAEISKFFGEQAVDALSGIATGSMTAMDALRQLLATLIKLLMQAVFLGEGPLAGNLKGTGGLFGNLGKQLIGNVSAPTASAPAPEVKSISTPSSTTTEQTFAAPSGTIERAPLAPVQQTVEGLRGSITEAASTAFAPVTEALKPLGKSGGIAFELGGKIRGMKPAADYLAKIDKILGETEDGLGAVITSGGQHRKGTGHDHERTGSTRHDIGPDGLARTSDIVLTRNGKKVTPVQDPKLYQDFLQNSAAEGFTGMGHYKWGVHVGGGSKAAWGPNKSANTLDPAFRDAIQKGWAGEKTRQLDTMSTGSIASQQAEAVQQQVEAQQRLAEQMAMTQQATQAMQQPLQGIGQAATQVVPNIGNLEQGVSGLIGPLTSAIPGLGQFGGAIQSLISQLLSMPMGGMGGGAGLLGGLLGFKEGGEISGPGTSTSDSIPILASDGEFMVNAKSAKKHRRLLDAINSGHVPAFAAGGSIGAGTFAPSSTYAPSLAINVTGSGNQKQDAALASLIAAQVDRSLDKHKPDTFRYSRAQALTKQAMDLRGASSRNG